MIRRFLLPSLVLAASLPVAPAAAQQVPTSDADALAAQLRIIAVQPTNVDALTEAGELSTRLGDLSGAASLFARADKADPRSGRVKAGMADVLLRSERPGEALRYFSQAEGYGYPVARFAAERGFAFDLVGQQGRAQRDYRVALAASPGDAEVTRRYALSLGISGQSDAALLLLDPLTRRNDRGAWRARAFILAMRGDVAAADAIATTMMPAGQSQGLAPFFARLPTLGPVDRAFAVHYGEVRATPQRLADARLAPALAPLAPEILPVARAAPVSALAAATTARPGAKAVRDPGRRRDASQPAASAAVAQAAPPERPAAATATPVQVAAVAPPRTRTVAPTPYYLPGSLIPHYLPRQASLPTVAANTAGHTPLTIPPVAVAPSVAAMPTPAGGTVLAPAPAASRPEPVVPAPVTQAVAFPSATPATPEPASTDPILARIANALATPGRELAAAGERAAASTSSTASVRTSAAPAPAPVQVQVPEPVPSAPVALAAAAPGRHVAAAPVTAGPVTLEAQHRGRRGVVTEEGRTEVADASPGRRGRRAAAPADEAAPPSIEQATTRRGRHAARGEEAAAEPAEPEQTPAERRAARKALAEKKAAAEKKAEAERAAAEERKAARAEPERYWVQVAGGANEGDLPKAWAAARGKAPALAGKKGWTTPLRATNRVLAGPFKTDDDARTFVNQLKKQGMSAFQFTSEAGQKVTRLDK